MKISCLLKRYLLLILAVLFYNYFRINVSKMNFQSSFSKSNFANIENVRSMHSFIGERTSFPHTYTYLFFSNSGELNFFNESCGNIIRLIEFLRHPNIYYWRCRLSVGR